VLSPFRTPLRVALAALIGAASLALLTSSASAGETSGERPDLPPSTREELAKIFDPALEELGLRTTRAGLQDLETYRFTDTGTHLAVYVEPIQTDGVEESFYVDRITSSAKVFLPKVFRRWSALESFDVCIEPVEIPGPTPPPVTQIFVTDDTYRSVKWKRADLSTLVERAAEESTGSSESGNRETFFLYVSPRLHDVPAYERAREDAGLPPREERTTPSTTARY
jgi:hypothetical protein